MVMKIFSCYDSKAEAFGNPFFARATGEAIRSFSDEVNRRDGNSSVAAHPEDYTLYELGEFDQVSGDIRIHSTRQNLGSGASYVRPGDDPVSKHVKAV